MIDKRTIPPVEGTRKKDTPPALTVTGLAVSNCVPSGKPDDPCKPLRTFSVKKLPVTFWVFTHSDGSIKGESFDMAVQFKDLSDKVLAEVDSSSTLTFPDQQDVFYYPTQIPADLGALQPGRYKMYCLALTADGVNMAEKTIIVTVTP
jgi:hypothetical protein